MLHRELRQSELQSESFYIIRSLLKLYNIATYVVVPTLYLYY